MGKDKLRKFKAIDGYKHVLQPSVDEVREGFHMRGKWNTDFFPSNQPLVLELGCGGGEYTVVLAQRDPKKNFLGMDIKGARLWKGASQSKEENLTNVGFLRTRIEWVEQCFAPGEVDEIWITFPDPQIKFQRRKHRMINPDFLAIYQRVLKPGGCIHLKSDSEFLHGYLHGLISSMGLTIHETYHDVYDQILEQPMHEALACKTFYEKMWLEQGKAITYLKFSFPLAN
ncbi:MAG: tRNA (guanosine(46)-N7)-methyltransferase TrmB [Schleiferiaceae bacterium]|jgi:tRNA (guanine-N7-)-methyltransferase|nr:tRNA (guanosine(46)-N7)-methyltransferase TrmB [Schleiferiaceae bacterium]MDG2225717.1 tRNA (guanosine(46)-N7)-methyltransferase TrmB [Schleiferiaceae bacterium]MDO7687422.1 tRNA (guanosine(46)-N7)-methyltransferase TrmB [Schleiferiaceae bacterium]MDO7719165.1 tRNA (guanosine(46)-N7)-methyltransferase TrmB [Schleiferiaceae bacterium]